MQRLTRISIVVVVSLITAASAQQVHCADDHSTPHYFNGGWVLPPPGSGWEVKRSRGDPELLFIRGISKDHTVAATVSTYSIDTTLSRDGLLEFCRRRSLAGQGRPLTPQSYEASLDSTIAPLAARYRYRVEDRHVPGQKGKPFILEAHGVMLFHPDAPHLLIVVEFSERARAPEPRTEATVGDSYLAELRLLRVDTSAVRRIEVGPFPRLVRLAHGSLWAVTTPEVGADVLRLDPSSLAILSRVHFDGRIYDLAATSNAVWASDVVNKAVLRLDPATGARTATVKCGERPGNLLATSDALWITNRENGTLQSVDLRTSELTGKPIRELKHPDSMIEAEGLIWIVNKNQTRTLACFDAKTRSLIGAPIPLGDGANSMAYGAGSLWIVCEEIDAVQRVDLQKRVVTATIELGFQPSSTAFAGGVLWVGNWPNGRLMQVDPETNKPMERFVQAGLRIAGMTTSDEGVWFADEPAGTVSLMPLP